MAAPNGQRGSRSSSKNHTTCREQFKYQPKIFSLLAVLGPAAHSLHPTLYCTRHWITYRLPGQKHLCILAQKVRLRIQTPERIAAQRKFFLELDGNFTQT
jgi:hypothetical protein